jgi:hypothetical protein
MTHMGKRFHRLGVIDHIGALSRLNFENALNLIQEELLNGSADNPQKREQSRETLNRFGQKLYALARYGQ